MSYQDERIARLEAQAEAMADEMDGLVSENMDLRAELNALGVEVSRLRAIPNHIPRSSPLSDHVNELRALLGESDAARAEVISERGGAMGVLRGELAEAWKFLERSAHRAEQTAKQISEMSSGNVAHRRAVTESYSARTAKLVRDYLGSRALLGESEEK